MTESMTFPQTKPLTIKILGVFFVCLTLYMVFFGEASIQEAVLLAAIGIFLLAYSIAYEINGDFNNKLMFCLFGMAIFKRKVNIFFPDYISFFRVREGNNSDWGPLSAIGNRTADSLFVIRFFKDRQHFTIYKSKNKDLALSKAKDLGAMLRIEVVDKT